MTERVESEHKEALCNCGYCQSPRFATHQVKTRDGQTEDVCGFHKRAFDVTGLAATGGREPTQRDLDEASYTRDVIKNAPERENVTEVPADLGAMRAKLKESEANNG